LDPFVVQDLAPIVVARPDEDLLVLGRVVQRDLVEVLQVVPAISKAARPDRKLGLLLRWSRRHDVDTRRLTARSGRAVRVPAPVSKAHEHAGARDDLDAVAGPRPRLRDRDPRRPALGRRRLLAVVSEPNANPPMRVRVDGIALDPRDDNAPVFDRD